MIFMLFFLAGLIVMTHSPIPMVITIISLSILTILNIISIIPWMCYFIFLIFIGGMMILFMYIVSLMKNKVLETKPMLVIVLSMGMLFLETPLQEVKMNNIVYEIFSSFSLNLTLLSIVYLFLMLVMAIKIIYFNHGPMRTN